MTEQEFDDYIMNEIAQEENEWYEQDEKNKNAFKEQLQGLAPVDELFEWLNNDHDGWHPIAVVEIETTDKQMPGYPSHECCTIKGSNTLFMKTSFDEVEGMDFYYVWQVTGMMGDDYSGELLLPLSDGRYFQVSYSC